MVLPAPLRIEGAMKHYVVNNKPTLRQTLDSRQKTKAREMDTMRMEREGMPPYYTCSELGWSLRMSSLPSHTVAAKGGSDPRPARSAHRWHCAHQTQLGHHTVNAQWMPSDQIWINALLRTTYSALPPPDAVKSRGAPACLLPGAAWPTWPAPGQGIAAHTWLV